MPLRPPLHRSMSFWAGILMAGFIGWAWWHSFRREVGIGYGDFVIANAHGGLWIEREHYAGSELSMNHRPLQLWHYSWEAFLTPFFAGVEEAAKKDDFLDGHLQTEDRPRDHCLFLLAHGTQGSWMLFLPHWLLLSALCVLWLGFLGWRTQRRRKGEMGSAE